MNFRTAAQRHDDLKFGLKNGQHVRHARHAADGQRMQDGLLLLVPYTLAALEIWKTLSGRFGRDVDYHRTGGYKIATTPQEAERLETGVKAQAQAGLPVRFM